MPQISAREWLYELADRSDLVQRYLKIHNTPFDSDMGRLPPDVLEPAVLVGLISVLVEQVAADARCRAERDHLRTVLTDVNDLLLSVPRTEDWRRVVREKVVKALYGEAAWGEVGRCRFLDFLKSLWRRLRRRATSCYQRCRSSSTRR